MSIRSIALAAMLALTPVPALAQTGPAQISNEEVVTRARVCLALAQNQVTAEQVVRGLNLRTDREVRDFALQCRLFFLGLQTSTPRTTT